MKYASSKQGFTLTEMLVAIAVTLIIGTAVFSIMLGAAKIWRDGVAGTSNITEFDDFDTDFSRDFNSSCPSCGFFGNATNCTFATFRLTPLGECVLENISYTLADGRIISSRGQVYNTTAIENFIFNTSTNIPCETFTTDFFSTNSAPAQIAAKLQIPHTSLTRRIYMRSAE